MKKEIPTYKLLLKPGREALSIFYERYGKRLFTYGVYNWKLGEDDCWDLIYKTLYSVAATIKKNSFDSEEKFAAFVFTVFMNNLRNHYRDSKVKGRWSERMRQENIGIENEPDKSISEEADEPDPLLNLLNKELELLEDWERILLLMRSQDFSYNEIAKITGKEPNNLKVYYQRLKKRITERMNQKISEKKVKDDSQEN